MKDTNITLSLVDQFVKIPRGIVEDDLIQVDEFYYLFDFVILDVKWKVRSLDAITFVLERPYYERKLLYIYIYIYKGNSIKPIK